MSLVPNDMHRRLALDKWGPPSSAKQACTHALVVQSPFHHPTLGEINGNNSFCWPRMHANIGGATPYCVVKV